MDGWPERGCGHMGLAVVGKLIGTPQAVTPSAKRDLPSKPLTQILRWPRRMLYAAIIEITITCSYIMNFAGPFEFFALDKVLRVLCHVEATDKLSHPALYVHRHLYHVPHDLIIFGRCLDYHPQHSELGYHLPLW